MGYGCRTVTLTELPRPVWQQALADTNRHIELSARRDPEAHRLWACIHGNLGNYAEADRDRQTAVYPSCGGRVPGNPASAVPKQPHVNRKGDDGN